MRRRVPSPLKGGWPIAASDRPGGVANDERDLGLNQWEADCPTVDGIGLAVPHPEHPGRTLFDWAARLDRAMLEHALAHLAQHPEPVALSLSAASVREPRELRQLLEAIKANPQQAALLTLELDERYLPPPAELEQLGQAVRETGASLGLQHFGGRFSLIGNLAHLGLAYLKIDGTYIRAIDQESDKRLFIEALFRATNSIDLPLIAEMVESQGELDVLRELGIRGAMGRLIGAPAPWHG